jgi:ATP-binding cassette, subfamily B, bacterial
MLLRPALWLRSMRCCFPSSRWWWCGRLDESQSTESLSSNLRLLLTNQTTYHANLRVVEKAASMDPACFDNAAFYDQLSASRDQVWRISPITYQSFDMSAQLLSLLSLLVLLASVHWLAPIAVVLMSVPKLVNRARFTRKRAAMWMNYTPTRRMIDYTASILGERDYVNETRLFQLEPHLLDKMRKSVRAFLAENRALAFGEERWNAGLSLLPLIGTASIWIYVAYEALARRRTVGDLALTFQVLESSHRAMDQIAFSAAFLVENTFFVTRLFAYLDASPASFAGALKRPAPDAPERTPNLRGSVVFDNVSFRYPGADKDTLSRLTFRIEPGERVAFVGENGAGKTTLIKLLTRLYDPTEGAITCDGVDLRDMTPESWRRKVGVIFQDFVRYDLTLEDNLGFGDIERYLAGVLNERLQTAAGQGGAHQVAGELSKGYQSVLGRRFEDGIDLSGGQWQKIALSRAFVREADLLILDEPTAALDAFAEAEVYRRFAELTQGRSTVFVTHRLSSVKMAQKILVLKNGVLIEQGDHAALMAQAGEYASMYTLQAERYG